MGDWLCEVQLPSGAMRGGVGVNDYPIVFNTGQVLLGWMALHEETEEDRYLECARRAADWLVEGQSEDGSWIRHTFNDIALSSSHVLGGPSKPYRESRSLR